MWISTTTWAFRFQTGDPLVLESFSAPSGGILSVDKLLSLPELCTEDRLPFSDDFVRPFALETESGVDLQEIEDVRFGTSGGIFLLALLGRDG